jgi:hypothetical protein
MGEDRKVYVNQWTSREEYFPKKFDKIYCYVCGKEMTSESISESGFYYYQSFGPPLCSEKCLKEGVY